MLKLDQIFGIPKGLLELKSPRQLQQIFGQPTLMHLAGKLENPLFVTVLLHANEDTSFYAVQELLKQYQDKDLPRSISVFFGNIEASKYAVRRLPGQPDYNRVWPGGDHPQCDETRLMQSVIDQMAKRQPFASIDVHNNTGKNPHYACINSLDTEFLHLAAMFSRTVVFFETPKGVQSMAMAKHCPSVTLECGQTHQQYGVEHATNYLTTVLHLDEIRNTAIHNADIDVFQTMARVTVADNCSFGFDDSTVDIRFDPRLDRLNFSELPEGTVFGEMQNPEAVCIQAWDDQEQLVSGTYFRMQGNKIVLNTPMMPAMLTLDKKIVRQDCLCYLMKRMELGAVKL